jgi:hypothetical protein
MHPAKRMRGAATVRACWGVLAWLGATAFVSAQTPPAIRAVRFSVFSPTPITDVAFAPRAGAAAQTLQFYPTARSPRYEYRGTLPVRFLDATSGAVVAEAAIPPGITQALLLFAPIPPGAVGPGTLRYQISVVDDGPARHGPGGLVMINLSGLALSGTVNQEKVTVKAGLNPTLTIGRSARVALGTAYKNRTYQSYTATVVLGRNERALLIFFPPFYKGALEVQSRLLLDQPSGASAPRGG